MVKINPKSKIWFLTRIGKEIEWRIEKRKRICLQNLIPSRREREFFSKSRISRGEREFFLQNLDIRERLKKWKLNSPARDSKKWTISSRDILEIENLVNACTECKNPLDVSPLSNCSVQTSLYSPPPRCAFETSGRDAARGPDGFSHLLPVGLINYPIHLLIMIIISVNSAHLLLIYFSKPIGLQHTR